MKNVASNGKRSRAEVEHDARCAANVARIRVFAENRTIPNEASNRVLEALLMDDPKEALGALAGAITYVDPDLAEEIWLMRRCVADGFLPDVRRGKRRRAKAARG